MPKNNNSLVAETITMEKNVGFFSKLFANKLLLGMFVAALVGFALFVVAEVQYNKVKGQLAELKKDPNAEARREAQELIKKVGDLIILPSNEEPTVATVTDLKPLQGQPFFAQAQLGDKVLIFKNAKKAILYRPSTNKVIEVAPLNDDTTQNTDQTQPATQSVVTVLNGSGISGEGKRISDKIKALGLTISKVGDAAATQETTILYKDNHEKGATSINLAIGNQGTVKLDNSIDSDIVITLGKNYLPK